MNQVSQESKPKEYFDNSNKVSTIVRAPHSRKYFVMANQSAQDKTLSWGATGLLAYLLSLPDNWEIRKDELCKHKTNGRDSTRGFFDELIKKKYLYKYLFIINGLRRSKYYFFEKPYDEQSAEFKEFIYELKKCLPDAGFQRSEAQRSETTTLQSTNKQTTQKINTYKKEKEKEKEKEKSTQNLILEKKEEGRNYTKELKSLFTGIAIKQKQRIGLIRSDKIDKYNYFLKLRKAEQT